MRITEFVFDRSEIIIYLLYERQFCFRLRTKYKEKNVNGKNEHMYSGSFVDS